MNKLMAHLAQFASFSKQGELLCTQSLGYLLKNTDAQRKFVEFLGDSVDSTIPETLIWRTEQRQSDGTRPDVEGYRVDGIPIVKIEGKLDAQFGKGQLTSYMTALYSPDYKGNLFILVPRNRDIEAANHAKTQFPIQGNSPWRVQNVRLAVITWEDLFQKLGTVRDNNFLDDLSQLHALYRVLNGDDMEPLTTDKQGLLWRQSEEWWNKLVNITTREIAKPGAILPLDREKGAVPYYRRYICRNIRGVNSCYSVGVRDPFVNHLSPIWLRFHGATGNFQAIAQQLERSRFASKLVHSGKHIWYPLEVPEQAERNVMIDALVSQVTDIEEVAYSQLPKLNI
jgi:hypothetical protein